MLQRVEKITFFRLGCREVRDSISLVLSRPDCDGADLALSAGTELVDILLSAFRGAREPAAMSSNGVLNVRVFE
jgi:hypothetical protein